MNTIHEAIQLFDEIILRSNEKIMRELTEELIKGISREQYEVLALLKFRGDQTPGEIAQFQNVKKSAMSNRLSKLLDKGYIVYTPDPTGDKRSKQVQLTEEGLKIATQIQSHYRSVIAEIFEDLHEDEELDVFINLLKRIQERLKEKE